MYRKFSISNYCLHINSVRVSPGIWKIVWRSENYCLLSLYWLFPKLNFIIVVRNETPCCDWLFDFGKQFTPYGLTIPCTRASEKLAFLLEISLNNNNVLICKLPNQKTQTKLFQNWYWAVKGKDLLVFRFYFFLFYTGTFAIWQTPWLTFRIKVRYLIYWQDYRFLFPLKSSRIHSAKHITWLPVSILRTTRKYRS